jgi:F0F1-type ATP synthase assembly protein I
MKERPDRPNRSKSDSESHGGLFAERAAKSFQESIIRAGPVAMASYTLIGAILLLGGIGYALDAWRGGGHWFLFGGLLLGLIVGFYELAKAVFK